MADTSKNPPLSSSSSLEVLHFHLPGSQIFQYFLEVVPTDVQTSYANVETYQYAVTEKVWIERGSTSDADWFD